MSNTKPSKNRIKYAKSFLLFFLIAFVLASAVGVWARGKLEDISDSPLFGDPETRLIDELDFLVPSDSPLYETFTESERMNILCLGVNQGLTDVIIVASYDIKNQKIDLISIPRDTYVYRPQFSSSGFFKINSIYHTSAKNAKGENKDPLAIAKAVSDVLQGMPIHYYAVIDYESVRNIVNAMGGVPFDVPVDMDYEDPYDTPPLSIHIKKGLQTLDGDTAVKVLRYRKGYTGGDLERIQTQQSFLKAAFKQLIKSDLLKMARVISDSIDSDITWGLVTKVVATIGDLSSDSFSTYTMPNDIQSESPWYVYPRPEDITELIKQIYSNTPDAPLNGDAGSNSKQ